MELQSPHNAFEVVMECSSSSIDPEHFLSPTSPTPSRETVGTTNDNYRTGECEDICSCEHCKPDPLNHIRANRNTSYLVCVIATVQAEVTPGVLVYKFMGIPFAEPPVRELRFALPRPCLLLKGTIHWPRHARVCPQTTTIPLPTWLHIHAEELDEDCLQLNIWSPDINCMDIGQQCGNRTVVVFFHGGEFQFGANKLYDGSYLAAIGDIVVVIPNYRLGALGFAKGARPRGKGNLGIYDQLTALKWVRENIGYFGGNASKIVLMGHGSGATSVGYLMLFSQLTRSVERFILLSGSPFRRYRDNTNLSTENVRNLAVATRCSERQVVLKMNIENLLDCLKRVNASTIVERSGMLGKPTFVPHFASELLPKPPVQLAQKLTVTHKQILLGNVADEGSLAMRILTALYGDSDSRTLHPVLQSLFRIMGIINPNAIIEEYQRRYPSQVDYLSAAYGDVVYYCPVYHFAHSLAVEGNDVFAYIFDHAPSTRRRGTDRAAHYDDVECIFGSILERGNSSPTGAEKELAKRLVLIVATFAKTGRPPTSPGSIDWPKFVAGFPVVARIFTGSLQYINFPSAHRCNRLRKAIL
ncbi:para-nitrobenzyl esterase-like isoform X2 [Ornithodoros turicata]|uniref:para-nitrobenzyl esterase-like isoform X2 n=1 Tax=Ornithodoros turicata TaxID=34597 RepID=UPI003139062E